MISKEKIRDPDLLFQVAKRTETMRRQQIARSLTPCRKKFETDTSRTGATMISLKLMLFSILILTKSPILHLVKTPMNTEISIKRVPFQLSLRSCAIGVLISPMTKKPQLRRNNSKHNIKTSKMERVTYQLINRLNFSKLLSRIFQMDPM